MDRRTFLRCLEGLAVAGGGSLLLPGCAGLAYVPSRVEDGRLVVRLADLDKRDAVLIAHPGGDRPLFLHRVADGTFTAVSTRCTHRGCQVEPAGTRLVCPCHGSEYTLRGQVVRSPAERDLSSFRVEIDGALLYIIL